MALVSATDAALPYFHSYKSSGECILEADGDVVLAKVWFTTSAFTADQIGRLESVELSTEASHQGWIDDPNQSVWSWFQLVVFDDVGATTPRTLPNGNAMAIETNLLQVEASYTMQQNGCFTKDHELLSWMEPGNVIGVRVCCQYPGWRNNAKSGTLTVKFSAAKNLGGLNDSWSQNHLLFNQPSPGFAGILFQHDHLRYACSQEIRVTPSANNADTALELWFSTQALDQDCIDRLVEVRLSTISHYIYHGPDIVQPTGQSWFELAILASANDAQPILGVKGPLVYWSHQIPKPHFEHLHQVGWRFKPTSPLLSSLKPGNVIGVRVCANGPGKQIVAKSAKLDMLLSRKVAIQLPVLPIQVSPKIDTIPTGTNPPGKHANALITASNLNRPLYSKYVIDVKMMDEESEIFEIWTLNINGDVPVPKFNTVGAEKSPAEYTLSVAYQKRLSFGGFDKFEGYIGQGRYYLITDRGVVFQGLILGGPTDTQDFVGAGTWLKS